VEGCDAIVSVRDLTIQHRMEEALGRSLLEKETLLREVHHRVKNNLQIISSLLTLQSRTLEEGKGRDALSDAVNRVRSLAYVHQLLYGTEHLSRVDVADYARALGGFLVGALEPSARLELDVHRVEVPIDTAVPCGLLLNELLTNALKHGREADGTVRLRVEIRPESDAFLVVVSDHGPGFPENPGSNGSLGMQLVRNLGRQLRATVALTSEGGAVARVRVPLASPPH
jgi:two-component sensor histidine kinase